MAGRRRRSGRRSGANSRRRRRTPLVFFIDECLGGQRLAQVLVAQGASVVLARDRFPAGTPDAEWLPVVGALGWIVLTKDRHIRRRPLELYALVRARVRAFVLTATELSGEQQAAAFIKALPRIERICRSSKRPVIAAVSERGGVSVIRLHRRFGA
jgi:hypothetical protein